MSFMRDITDDISKVDYAYLIQQVSVPEYVKSASVETIDSVKDLQAKAFADPFRKKFPVNTKASCWTSALYLYGNEPSKTSAKWVEVEGRISKHAHLWGIVEDVEAIKAAFAEEVVDPKYALEMEFLGETVQKCPCHTPEYAKLSCNWLQEHKNNFPLETQIKAAQVLKDVLEDYTEIPSASREYLIKLCEADNGATDVAYSVASEILNHLTSVKKANWGEEGANLLQVANKLANLEEGSLAPNPRSIAQAIEEFDTKAGLDARWGGGVTHPVDAVFNISRSKAASLTQNTIKLMNGNYVNIDDIPSSALEDGLKKAGDDFLNYAKPDGINLDMGKVIEVMPTIPAPDATRMQSAFPDSSEPKLN